MGFRMLKKEEDDNVSAESDQSPDFLINVLRVVIMLLICIVKLKKKSTAYRRNGDVHR